jgi:hypothetical protein
LMQQILPFSMMMMIIHSIYQEYPRLTFDLHCIYIIADNLIQKVRNIQVLLFL